jgi:glyceraldehyde 3-phosphate dehydrogenase
MTNIGINGFGRIGRRLTRLLSERTDIKIVAINDLSDAKTLSHLLKYDSVHGVCNKEIGYDSEHILIGKQKIPLTNNTHPKETNWYKYNVDIVIECSGKFKTKEVLNHHLKNGAKKVILSAPSSNYDEIKTIVIGVNDHLLDGSETIISNASCTTNNAAPMIAIMDKYFTIKQAYITTVHSYTTDQSLHDVPHTDLRRARAASQSIVPTTTGAAKALTNIFPRLKSVIGGCGIRVPVINGSLTDITLNIEELTSIQDINSIFKQEADINFNKIIQYTDEPIVSVDLIGNSFSCVFDSELTSVIGNMVKIVGWYDNETGYTNRLIDLINISVKRGLKIL